MRVSTEAVATREVELTVEPDAERIRRAMRQAARRISKVRPVAGFRPGKAPYELVERMFGRETILNEALNEEAPAIYREAIAEAGLEPYEQALFDLESEEPVVLKMRVPLMPEVTLGDYTELSIEPEPEVSVSEAEIDEQVELLQRQHAEHVPVERPIEMGDQVVASVSGHAGEERVINQESATLNVTDEMMPPGFAEAILGASEGDTRAFTLSYPEDFDNEDLAGKTVAFEVTVKTVRQTNLPPIDDELAKMVGDYESLAQLRERIAEAMAGQKQAEARTRETRAAVQALVSVATVAYPEAALNNEISEAIDRQRNRLARMGFDFQRYLQMVNQTEDDLREQIRPEAVRSLTERLALGEYARREDVELSPAEAEAQFRAFAADIYSTYGERAEEALRNATASGAMAAIYAQGRLNKAARMLTNRLAGRPDEEAQPPSEEHQALEEFLEESRKDSEQE